MVAVRRACRGWLLLAAVVFVAAVSFPGAAYAQVSLSGQQRGLPPATSSTLSVKGPPLQSTAGASLEGGVSVGVDPSSPSSDTQALVAKQVSLRSRALQSLNPLNQLLFDYGVLRGLYHMVT